MLSQSDINAIGNIVDERLDIKLKKALRGVVRKKDLRAMENRIMRKINLVADSTDSRLLDLEKQVNVKLTYKI